MLVPTLVALAALAGPPRANAERPRTPNVEATYRQHASSIVFVYGESGDKGDTISEISTGTVLPGGRILTTCAGVRSGPDNAVDFDRLEVTIGRRNPKTGMVVQDRIIPATLLRCDRERNLALLHTKLPLPAPMRIAKRPASIGQRVTALGHSAHGLTWTVHACRVAGIGALDQHATRVVSAATKDAAERERKTYRAQTMLEVDCSRHPLYGTPILDADGQVVGQLQVSYFATDKRHAKSYYFYLAASEIQAFLDEE